jgi:sugar phosphate isomerase/epimerase
MSGNNVRVIDVNVGIFEENDRIAADVRAQNKANGTFMVNVMASPGAGKTTTLLRTIEDLRLPNLGVNLDTANMILYGRGNPVDALDVFGPWVRNLHIKDGVFSTNASSLGHETAVGEGKVDFEKVIRKLYALGFDGELIIEREIGGPRQLRDIIRARDYIQALVDICRPLE